MLITLALGLAQAADITLDSSEGVTLAADFEEASGATTGVVLVHMEKRKAADWRFLTARLNRAGFTTLAVDLRGHGDNIGEGESKPTLTDDDYAAMTDDVRAAVLYLREQGYEQVALVGAGVGANLSAQVAAREEAVSNLVLLSPGLELQGVSSGEAVKSYGERPMLIVVSDNDTYAAKSSLVLDGSAQGPHHLEVLTAAGQGTKMLNNAPELEPTIEGWLLGNHAALASAGQVGIAPTVEGDTTGVETDGKTMNER